MTTDAAGKQLTISRTEADDDQTYTFDDIELYDYVLYRGRPAYVLDKGEHVQEKVAGEHLEIEYANEHPQAKNNRTVVKDNLVNRYLREQRVLFVDFTGNLDPANHRPAVDEPDYVVDIDD